MTALDDCRLLAAPLAARKARVLARSFRLLADPTRLRLLSIVAQRDETCICDLVGALGVSQPTVSHHMKQLRDAGVVEGEPRGQWIYYRFVPGALDPLRDALASAERPAAPDL